MKVGTLSCLTHSKGLHTWSADRFRPALFLWRIPLTHQRHGTLLQLLLILDLNIGDGDVLVLGKIRHQQRAEGLDLMCTSLLLDFLNYKETSCLWVQVGHELFEGRSLIQLCIINSEQSALYTVFLFIPHFQFPEESQIPKHLRSTKGQGEAKNRSLPLDHCPESSAAWTCAYGVMMMG